MNADCALFTGKTHPVCQDYTRAGYRLLSGKKSPYVLVSDGCTGSPDTDVGSRLLTFAAEKALGIYREYDLPFLHAIITAARVTADSMGLHSFCLDATLVAAFMEESPSPSESGKISGSRATDFLKPQNVLYVPMLGDGTVALKFKYKKGFDLLWIEYEDNMPWYLSYLIDPKRKDIWEGMASGIWEHGTGNMKRAYIEPDGEMETDYLGNENLSFAFCKAFRNAHLVMANYTDLDWMAISSDGIHTFTKKTDSGSQVVIPTHQVASQLFDFKNFKGDFMKRQTTWFMRTFQKQGWQHDDDLSVAAIYFGD